MIQVATAFRMLTRIALPQARRWTLLGAATTTATRRGILSEAVEQRVAAREARHESLLEELSSSSASSSSSAARLGKEISTLSSIVALCKERESIRSEQAALVDLLAEISKESEEAEMRNECEQELEELSLKLQKAEDNLLDAILPHDEDDYDSDAILEVRAGTGGDEASLFCAEIFEAYQKTAKALRWKVDVLNESKTDVGGLKEGSMIVSGGSTFWGVPGSWTTTTPLGPYGAFKFESGVHRVQRVPVNDSRIQTSACSVAVLPFIDDSNSSSKEPLPLSELKIETMRSSGAGGQHVNTTDSAVRITHLPTGVTASIQDERSQHKNKEKALKLITARVRDAERAAAQQARGATRSSLMGGGDRSERIRTYNFPQDRITDHRCKETQHGIAGQLAAANADDNLVVTFFPYLRSMEREELLAQVEEEDEQQGR
jgi:peptide chain release factor 1